MRGNQEYHPSVCLQRCDRSYKIKHKTVCNIVPPKSLVQNLCFSLDIDWVSYLRSFVNKKGRDVRNVKKLIWTTVLPSYWNGNVLFVWFKDSAVLPKLKICQCRVLASTDTDIIRLQFSVVGNIVTFAFSGIQIPRYRFIFHYIKSWIAFDEVDTWTWLYYDFKRRFDCCFSVSMIVWRLHWTTTLSDKIFSVFLLGTSCWRI